ncbi:MAG: chlorite dismutase family protein [Candidatus Dormibacteria bacterium]
MSTTAVPLAVRDATSRTPTKRQFVRFAFYRIDPAWRRLPAEQRSADREEVARLIAEFAARDSVIMRTYTLVGTRGDADFLLWMVSDDLDQFLEFSSGLNHCRMSGWLTQPYHYFAMTKRSTYVDRHEHADGRGEGRSNRLLVVPGGRKYLFVYPFVKTRGWYRLSKEERQRQMTQHIDMGHSYPSVKINTTYSFGLDDQEFVVAFESDVVSDFLDLVQEMRESEASTHTVRDTPSFTCTAVDVEEMLGALG